MATTEIGKTVQWYQGADKRQVPQAAIVLAKPGVGCLTLWTIDAVGSTRIREMVHHIDDSDLAKHTEWQRTFGAWDHVPDDEPAAVVPAQEQTRKSAQKNTGNQALV